MWKGPLCALLISSALVTVACDYYARRAPADVTQVCREYMSCMEATIEGRGLTPFNLSETEFNRIERYYNSETGECWLYGDLVDDCERACKAFEVNNCPDTTGCDSFCGGQRALAEQNAGVE